MEGKSLAINSIFKRVTGFSILLMLAMNGYKLTYTQLLSPYFPWSYSIALIFLPIFCYLLQRKLASLSFTGMSTIWLLTYSMLMLWLASVLVATVVYLFSFFNQDWFFSTDSSRNMPDLTLFDAISSHLYWYTIFGVPSALLARLILYLKNAYFN